MRLPFLKDVEPYTQVRPTQGIVRFDHRRRQYEVAPLGLNVLYALLFEIHTRLTRNEWFVKVDELRQQARLFEEDYKEERRQRVIFQERLRLHGIDDNAYDEDPLI